VSQELGKHHRKLFLVPNGAIIFLLLLAFVKYKSFSKVLFGDLKICKAGGLAMVPLTAKLPFL
jgi:hypothetical protein